MNGNLDITLGIDFDNTIVNYDNLFYKYALEANLIEPGVLRTKRDIRDSIRRLPDGNDRWTELQGMVYGRYMDEAEPTDGLESFLIKCQEKGIRVIIISHKTPYPAMGPRYDLHAAAKKWLKDREFNERFGITDNNTLFVYTLLEKLGMISERHCTHFIDDLRELLTHPQFPPEVIRILFSKEQEIDLPDNINHFKSWIEIGDYLFGN